MSSYNFKVETTIIKQLWVFTTSLDGWAWSMKHLLEWRDPNATKVELLDEHDEIAVEMNAPKIPRNE